MKRFLITACTVGAAFSLTGCFGSSVPAPTTMQELFDVLSNEDLDNVTMETAEYSWYSSTPEVATIKVDGSKYQMDMYGTEMYMELKGSTATMYFEAEGTWFSMSTEYSEDDLEMGSGAEEIFGEGVKVEDFEEQENGTWVYSTDDSDYYGNVTRTFYTVEFTEGAVEIVVTEATVTTTTDEDGVETETVGTQTKTMSMKMYDFGSTKVTLPKATSMDGLLG